MADKKVSDLDEQTSLFNVDILYLVRDLGSVYDSVKTTLANLFLWMQSRPEKSTTLTPSAGSVDLNFATKVNIVTLTGATQLNLPDMSGWTAGEVMRLDLYVKQDATGGRDLTLETGWVAAVATLPTNTTDPNAIDRYVIDCVKDLGICAIGLAQADLS